MILHWTTDPKSLEAIDAVETMAQVRGHSENLKELWAASNIFKPSLELVNASQSKVIESQDEIRRFPRMYARSVVGTSLICIV